MTTKAIEIITKMCKNGATDQEVADAICCHRQTVLAWRRKLGIKSNRVGRPTRLFKIERFGGEKKFEGTTEECMEFLGMSYSGFSVAARRGHSKMYRIERVK